MILFQKNIQENLKYSLVKILGLLFLLFLPFGVAFGQWNTKTVCGDKDLLTLTGTDLLDEAGVPAAGRVHGEWFNLFLTDLNFDDKHVAETEINGFEYGTNRFYWTDKANHMDYYFAVTLWSNPDDLTVTILGSGCSGSTHTITVVGAEFGVTYRLYRDNTLGAPIATGVGSPIFLNLSFPGQTQAGTYIVTADNGSCPVVELSDRVTIRPTPEIYNITGTSGCEGTPVSIGLDNSEDGVTYRVIRTDAAGNRHEMGSVVASGSGTPISIGTFNNVGVYTVEAYEAGGCNSDMNGSVVVTSTPADLPFENISVLCNTGEVAINNSENGVRYSLFQDGTPTGSFRNGNGGRIVFGGLGPGVYTVVARSIDNPACEFTLSDSRLIQPVPTKPTLVASDTE